MQGGCVDVCVQYVLQEQGSTQKWWDALVAIGSIYYGIEEQWSVVPIQLPFSSERLYWTTVHALVTLYTLILCRT